MRLARMRLMSHFSAFETSYIDTARADRLDSGLAIGGLVAKAPF